ncbi:hypothetical protein D3C80_1760290 [compost metagenome]
MSGSVLKFKNVILAFEIIFVFGFIPILAIGGWFAAGEFGFFQLELPELPEEGTS